MLSCVFIYGEIYMYINYMVLQNGRTHSHTHIKNINGRYYNITML